MGLFLKPGDELWVEYYGMLSPYLGLTLTFSVEGNQLTTITQFWDDWTNELYDEILVYTRQP